MSHKMSRKVATLFMMSNVIVSSAIATPVNAPFSATPIAPKTTGNVVSGNIDGLVDDNDASIGFGEKKMVVFIDYGVESERSQIIPLFQFSKLHPEWKIDIKELPLISQESVDIAKAQTAVIFQQNEIAWREFESMVISSKVPETPEVLREFARKAKIDMAQYDKAMSDGSVMEKLKQTRALAQTAHIDGTPFFAINNRVSRGVLNYPGLVDLTTLPSSHDKPGLHLPSDQ